MQIYFQNISNTFSYELYLIIIIQEYLVLFMQQFINPTM